MGIWIKTICLGFNQTCCNRYRRSWLEMISRRPVDQRKHDYSRISSTETTEMR